MFNLTYKFLAIPFFIFPANSLSTVNDDKRALHKVIKSVYSKNIKNKQSLSVKINLLLSSLKSEPRFHLHQNVIWRLLDTPYPFPVIDFLLLNYSKLLSIFEDPNDILFFSKLSGTRKILKFLCNDVNRFELFNLFSFSDLNLLLKGSGVVNCLDLFLTKNSWPILCSRLGRDLIIKLSSFNGVYDFFHLILDDEIWAKLLDRVGFDNLLKILPNNSPAKILSYFFNDNKWHALMKRIDKCAAMQIAIYSRNAGVLDIILDDSIWDSLKNKLSIDMIIRLSKYSGAKSVLIFLSDNSNWSFLTSEFGLDNVLKMSSSNGSINVLNCLLDPDKFNLLCNRLTRQHVIYIANRDAASNIFEIILDDVKWSSLSSDLDADTIFKIANNQGSRQILNFIINDPKWSVFLDIVGKPAAIQIVSTHGAFGVIHFILNSDNWFKLLSVSDVDTVVKVCSSHGALKILQFMILSDKWETLKLRLGYDNLTEIIKARGTRQVLDFFSDDAKWDLLKSRIDIPLIVKIAKQYCAIQVFNYLIDGKTWSILNQIEDKDSLSGFLSKPRCIVNIQFILNRYSMFLRYFSPSMISQFSTLSSDNKSGLTVSALDCLTSRFGLQDAHIFDLATVSTRYLSYVLKLIDTESAILDPFFKALFPLFDFHSSTSFAIDSFNSLSFGTRANFKSCHWLIFLSFLHKHCDYPISTDEISFFTSQISRSFVSDDRFDYLCQLFKLAGSYSIKDRALIWNSLFNQTLHLRDNWIDSVSLLSLNLRLWFILRGHMYSDYLFSNLPPEQSFIVSHFTVIDHNNLFLCLQNTDLRSYFRFHYSSQLSSLFSFFPKCDINEYDFQSTVVQAVKPRQFNCLHWLKFVLELFSIIDFELNSRPFSNSTLPVLHNCFFSSSSLLQFSDSYPKICFSDDRIVVGVNRRVVDFLFSSVFVTQSFSDDLSTTDSSIYLESIPLNDYADLTSLPLGN